MKTASGYYLNLYEETGRDIYIIFNEANGEPTRAELVALQYVIEEQLKKSDAIADLENAIEETEFDCVAFGFQVLVSHVKSDLLRRG